jgi:hypothetical protein
MQMHAGDIKRFPKLQKLVSIVLPFDGTVPEIVKNIRAAAGTGVSEETIKKALIWGQGPMIEVVPMKDLGRFKFRKRNKVFIRRKLVKEYEAGASLTRETASGRVTSLVEVTLLHELTHLVDFQAEEGNAFEEATYGEVVT